MTNLFTELIRFFSEFTWEKLFSVVFMVIVAFLISVWQKTYFSHKTRGIRFKLSRECWWYSWLQMPVLGGFALAVVQDSS